MSCCEFLVIEEESCIVCNKGNENIRSNGLSGELSKILLLQRQSVSLSPESKMHCCSDTYASPLYNEYTRCEVADRKPATFIQINSHPALMEHVHEYSLKDHYLQRPKSKGDIGIWMLGKSSV